MGAVKGDVVWHLSPESIHYEVYPLLHHLHLCNHVQLCRICDGWTTGVLLLLSARGVAAFWSFLVSSFGAGTLLVLPTIVGSHILWPSCSSKSWFCLVRHSTFAARVYSCLLRAVVHGSSPLLLLVAIERVSAIQHFVWEVVIWLLLFSPFPTNDANWWCQKSLVSCTVLTCSRQDLRNINKEDLAESTSVTPAKYPPRVKLERISTTLKCQSWEKLHVPWLVRALEGFYSSVKLTFVSWWRMSFLVGKILINIRILRDLFLVEIPLIRVNHVMQGISLNWYLWRSSQATLDPSAVSPRWSLASSETSRWLHRDDC